MSAAHDYPQSSSQRHRQRLAVVLTLVASYMLAEVLAGLLTNSLALLADAGHMFSDVAALGLSLFAIRMARRPPDPRRTYGYYRTEILAALVNGATLVAVAVFIFVEALTRFREPLTVHGAPMTGVAVGGLLVNLTSLWVLHHGRDASLNIRGAWLHVLTDTLGSLQAIAAGALIWAFGWNLADPIASIAIGLLVIYSAWDLLKATLSVLMESAPGHIDVDEVRNAILSLPRVAGVHDLHVWSLTSGLECLSAHVVTAQGEGTGPAILKEIRHTVQRRFGIDHITIQLEPEAFDESEAAICIGEGC